MGASNTEMELISRKAVLVVSVKVMLNPANLATETN